MKIQKLDNFSKDNSFESLDEIVNVNYTQDMLLEMANISQKTNGFTYAFYLLLI